MDLFVDHPAAAEFAALLVPSWVRGAWTRDLLEWEGGEDRTTRVLWLQTPLLFADLRSPPSGHPGDEKGFAGNLLVSGQICAWQRPLDLEPPSGPGDAGVMYRNGASMIECGIHANYREDWRQLDDGSRHLAATRGEVAVVGGEVVWPAEGALEILVACGGHVVHAIRKGRTAALRYGLFDAATGTLEPAWQVGRADIVADVSRPWTLWSSTLKPVARDSLLGSLDAL